MSDEKIPSPEARQAELAPETHNDEQDEHGSQAQEVARQARDLTEETASPTESTKAGPAADSEQDVIDHMRDMERSGRIDMDAFRGEPNHDDDEGKYGEANKLDKDLPSDGE